MKEKFIKILVFLLITGCGNDPIQLSKKNHNQVEKSTETEITRNHLTDKYLKDVVPEDRKKEFQKMISDVKTTHEEILEKINQALPSLRVLFKSQNSNAPGKLPNTIESHSIEVMNQYVQYAQINGINNELGEKNDIKNLQGLMKVTLALHDIGKPIAGSKLQKKYTKPILIHSMHQLGFNPRQIEIAQEIVLGKLHLGHAIITANQNGFQTATKAIKKMHERSKHLKLDPLLFFHIKTGFFIADGSYYPAFSKTFDKLRLADSNEAKVLEMIKNGMLHTSP